MNDTKLCKTICFSGSPSTHHDFSKVAISLHCTRTRDCQMPVHD
jgi:hypothetical protein